MKRFAALLAFVLAFAPLQAVKWRSGLFVNSRDGLNVRDEPGTGARKVGVLRYGDFVRLRQLGGTATIDGISGRWTKVAFGGAEGWVFGGYLQADCPMDEDEAVEHLRRNDPLIADFFPRNRGTNYILDGEDEWDFGGAEYSMALENFCADAFAWSGRKEALAVRDCLFLAEGMAEGPSTLRLVRAGTKIRLDRVSGWGIRGKILFPVYSATIFGSDGATGGLVRGIDVAGGECASAASDGRGSSMTLMFQGALRTVTSGGCGTERAKIEEALGQGWTYEGASLRGGYELVSAVFLDPSGGCHDVPISEFGEISPWISEHVGHVYGHPKIEYPLNMRRPVPFVALHWYYGGQGGGTCGVKIYTLRTDGRLARLNHVCDYEYCDTDGGPTGMGYHYYTSDGVNTYAFEQDCGNVTQNMTSCYVQDPSDPLALVHEESRPREPEGRGKAIARGRYANPICRLKIRSSPGLGGGKIGTVRPGTLLEVVEVGGAERIDGIRSNWVKVRAVNEARFLDGYAFEEGWVFGGFLE